MTWSVDFTQVKGFGVWLLVADVIGDGMFEFGDALERSSADVLADGLGEPTPGFHRHSVNRLPGERNASHPSAGIDNKTSPRAS